MPRNSLIPFLVEPWTGPSAVRTVGPAGCAAIARDWSPIGAHSRPSKAAAVGRTVWPNLTIVSLPSVSWRDAARLFRGVARLAVRRAVVAGLPRLPHLPDRTPRPPVPPA